jgi:hypothetical protein
MSEFASNLGFEKDIHKARQKSFQHWKTKLKKNIAVYRNNNDEFENIPG